MTPPRFARWLLGLGLAPAEREAWLAEMAELHAIRTASLGARRARWLYRREALGLLLGRFRERAGRSGGRQSSRWQPPARRVAPASTWLDDLLQDGLYALRSLRQRPVFAFVAVATLALGIGLNTTVFTFVNTVLLRPLPVQDPAELVEIFTREPDEGIPATSSYPDYVDLAAAADSLVGMAGHAMTVVSLARGGRGELTYGELVTGNYFSLMGIRPAIGRLLAPTDDVEPGGHPVIVLGHSYWRDRFGGDPNIVGDSVVVNGRSFTVIGVAAAGFRGLLPLLEADFWVPAAMGSFIDPVGVQSLSPSPTGDTRPEQRGNRWLQLKGRLRPAATLARATQELQAAMERLARVYPETNDRHGVTVLPASSVRIHPLVDGALAPAAGLVLAMVGLVLLLTCANLANMLLSRATARQQEIAVRLAIGAGRGRLVRQLLAESLLLSALGGLAGLLITFWTARLLIGFQPPIPFALSLDLGLDWRVFAFGFALALASGLLFGLAPALQSSRPDLTAALRDGARGSVGARGRLALRILLVVGQVSVCTVLLIGAMLLLRSVRAAESVDVGFDTEGLAIVGFDLSLHGYDAEQGRAFYDELVRRARELPGTVAVSRASRYPFAVQLNANGLWVEGHQTSPEDPPYSTEVAHVDAAYFDTLGVELLRGRWFEPADMALDAAGVAIISNALAESIWPGDNAVGRAFHTRGLDGPRFEVIGVTRDYKVRTVGEDPQPYVHFPAGTRLDLATMLALKSRGGAAGARAELRRIALEMDPDLAIVYDTDMPGLMSFALFPVRAGASMMLLFGGLALVLAALGLYGVIAYSVSRRTREIGIRMALGAEPGRVLRRVLSDGMRLVLPGLAIGVLLALLVGRALTSFLYGVGAGDPLAFAVAVSALLVVACAANVLPARRAARVDPVDALRDA